MAPTQPTPRSRLVTIAAALGAAAVLALATWAWIHVPALYPTPAPSGIQAVDATREATRSQAIVTTRASVLAALAGLGALITIAINYRNSQITNRTFRITERGHLTDRYAKAIEQLGTTEGQGALAIRLGGIYALQQFAIETDRPEDQRTVVEVLSAFVRASLPRRTDAAPRTAPEDPPGDEADTGCGVDPDRRQVLAHPALDVLAAISSLARLPERIDLRADFSGVDFSELILTDTDFHRARLHRAAFRRADLTGADLRGADLRGVDLSGADLRRADLRGADFHRAGLRGVHLTDADLQRIDLSGFYLRGGTNLDTADLRGADLRDASLNDADLRGADLDDTDLRHADLRSARLEGAHLRGADLEWAAINSDQLSAEQRASVHHSPLPDLDE